MRTGFSGGGDTVHLTEGEMAGSQDGDVVMRRLGGEAAPRGKERNMEVIDFEKKAGIRPAPAFAEKGLATHSCNVGILCGHGCVYCSTPAVNRCQLRKACGMKSVTTSDGVAVRADPDAFVEAVSRDAKRMRPGLVELCTTVDAWSPEAQEHDLGRRCLQAILDQPGWTVRVLTKNVAVTRDFDLIERHRDRVQVGLSITATARGETAMRALEPNASSNAERTLAMVEAHRRGLRTFGMFCPLFPEIADRSIHDLVGFARSIDAEEIFMETVNMRGDNLPRCVDALRGAGFGREADSLAGLDGTGWSEFTREAVRAMSAAARHFDTEDRMRFLLYPGRLTARDAAEIRRYGDMVKWLEKGEGESGGS